MASTKTRVTYWSHLSFAADAVCRRIEELPNASLRVTRNIDDTIRMLAETDVLILTDCAPDDAKLLASGLSQKASQVRALHFLSAGRNGFNDVVLPKDITINGTIGAVAPTAAEHAMALLLSLTRRIGEAALDTKRQRIFRPDDASIDSVQGKTALIVGLGPIGRKFSGLAKVLGIELIGVTRSPDKTVGLDFDVFALDAIDALLPRADIIVLAIAMTEDTQNILSATRLTKVKPGAILINVCRGGVVDTDALDRALRSGALGGAGLDVTDPEPLPTEHPLWKAPNLIVTGHYAGVSRDSEQRLAEEATASVLAAHAQQFSQSGL